MCPSTGIDSVGLIMTQSNPVQAMRNGVHHVVRMAVHRTPVTISNLKMPMEWTVEVFHHQAVSKRLIIQYLLTASFHFGLVSSSPPSGSQTSSYRPVVV